MDRMRIAVVGTEEVGKTELLRSFCESVRIGDLLNHVEMSPPSAFVPKRTFYKTVQLEDHKVEVIFEERGEQQLLSLNGFSALIFIYDISNHETYYPINDLVIPEDWKSDFPRQKKFPVFLVGNKLDRIAVSNGRTRNVVKKEVIQFSTQRNIINEFFETSLNEFEGQKNEQKLEYVFNRIINTIYQTQRTDIVTEEDGHPLMQDPPPRFDTTNSINNSYQQKNSSIDIGVSNIRIEETQNDIIGGGGYNDNIFEYNGRSNINNNNNNEKEENEEEFSTSTGAAIGYLRSICDLFCGGREEEVFKKKKKKKPRRIDYEEIKPSGNYSIITRIGYE